jgi:hypothetical protein
MKARWVSHNPSPRMPLVAQTRVAMWWPGKYYFVTTMKVDRTTPLSRLTESIRELFPQAADTPIAEYVTAVSRTNKDGALTSGVFYQRQYSELSEAREGHKSVVAALEDGRKL